MGGASERTGSPTEAVGETRLMAPHGERRWLIAAVVLASSPLVVLGTTGCASLWTTATAAVPARPADAFSCVVSQARQMGYHVAPDSSHAEVQAEKILPLGEMGPDAAEYTRKNVLAVAVHPARSNGGSTLVVRAETISVQQTRRGLTDVAVPASGAVRQDADALVARCQHAVPNTSLPG